MDHKTVLLSSWMFVPGDLQKMIDKAVALPVDAILLDIEDGVAQAAKGTARKQIAESRDRIAVQKKENPSCRTPARYVRINAVGHERMNADVEYVIRPALEGLAVPKVETPDQVNIVERILDDREPKMGMLAGSVRLLIALESPRGLFNAYAIATSSPRVIGLMFGAEDFSRELSLPLRREGEAVDLIYARSAMVTAAVAAHVQAVDGVWPNFQDIDGLRKFALQSRRLGFSSMSLIHPSQIDEVNRAFTPTIEEIDYCRRVVQAFDDARARGEGSIAFGGQLLDVPIVDRARQTLALAQSLNSQLSTHNSQLRTS